MSDSKAFWAGVTGLVGSMTLEQWNSIASLIVAGLTAAVLIVKLYKDWKGK